MGNGKRDRRRIVDPRDHRVPAFIRLSEAFVENLSQILRLGLVIGGIVLVQELAELRGTFSPAVTPDQAHMEKPEPPANTADSDDTGFILYESRVLYARLRRD